MNPLISCKCNVLLIVRSSPHLIPHSSINAWANRTVTDVNSRYYWPYLASKFINKLYRSWSIGFILLLSGLHWILPFINLSRKPMTAATKLLHFFHPISHLQSKYLTYSVSGESNYTNPPFTNIHKQFLILNYID